MSAAENSRPLGDLLSGLVSDLSMLFRKEVELAKTEASEKLDQLLAAGRNLAIGAVLAIGATGVLLAALVSGLAAIFVNLGMQPSWANFLAAVIVAFVIGGIAWAMIARGAAELKAEKLSMERTTRSLQMDATVARETL